MTPAIRQYRSPEYYDAVIAPWRSVGEGVHLGDSDARAEIARKHARDPELFLVVEKAGRIIGTVIGVLMGAAA